MRTLFLIFLCGWIHSALGASVTVDLGDSNVVIPVPKGYTELTKEMGETYDYHYKLVSPNNVLLKVFIQDDDAKTAIGEPSNALIGIRRISIQASKAAVGRAVTQEDLWMVNRIVAEQSRTQLDAMQESAKTSIGRALKLAGDYSDLKVALSFSKFMPLPIHDESSSHFTFTAYTRAKLSVSNGNEVDSFVATTSTTMIVRARMLMISMVGDSKDRELQQMIHKSMVKDILAANE